MSGVRKVCVVCGEDCSTRPRVKDPKGRYTCKACLPKVAPAAAAAAPGAASDDDLMAAMVDEVAASRGEPCPGCGGAMQKGQVICTQCGYNVQRGAQMQTRVEHAPEEREPPRALASAAAVADSNTAMVMRWIIGGCIGGLIGAAIWGGVAYSIRLELGWIAWGVGALVGAGVSVAGRGTVGTQSGVVAVAIAILAVLGGKFLASYLNAQAFVESVDFQEMLSGPATDEELIVQAADDIAYVRWQRGEPLDWPDGMDYWSAGAIEDYPADVLDEAEARLASMSPEEQEARREIGTIDDMPFIAGIADDIAIEREARGEPVSWPNSAGMEEAFHEIDYPADLWQEAGAQWRAMGPGEQQLQRERRIQQAAARFDSARGEFTQMAAGEAFAHSFTLFDILWFAFAIGSAFTIGANGTDPD